MRIIPYSISERRILCLKKGKILIIIKIFWMRKNNLKKKDTIEKRTFKNRMVLLHIRRIKGMRLNRQIVISDFKKTKNTHRDRKAIKFLGIIITEIFRKLKKIIRRHSTGKTDSFPVVRQAVIILLDLQFLKIKSVKCRLVQRHRLRLGLKLQG